jgi:uroporphyrinogen III methyltransferase/synthase
MSGPAPLGGVRILVTRARQQAAEFSAHLAGLGALAIEIPTIEIRPVVDSPRIRGALERLPETRLCVFTSANAVKIFCDFLTAAGYETARLGTAQICAIGSETARALERRGLTPDLVAGEYTAEGLVEALAGWDLRDARVLVPRAAVGRDVLPELLARRGAEVEMLTVYETVMPPGTPEALHRLFAGDGVDVITFTSSSTVQNFATAFPERDLRQAVRGARVACMGPVTAATAEELGLPADIVARDFTTRGLAAAITSAYNPGG